MNAVTTRIACEVCGSSCDAPTSFLLFRCPFCSSIRWGDWRSIQWNAHPHFSGAAIHQKRRLQEAMQRAVQYRQAEEHLRLAVEYQAIDYVEGSPFVDPNLPRDDLQSLCVRGAIALHLNEFDPAIRVAWQKLLTAMTACQSGVELRANFKNAHREATTYVATLRAHADYPIHLDALVPSAYAGLIVRGLAQGYALLWGTGVGLEAFREVLGDYGDRCSTCGAELELEELDRDAISIRCRHCGSQTSTLLEDPFLPAFRQMVGYQNIDADAEPTVHETTTILSLLLTPYVMKSGLVSVEAGEQLLRECVPLLTESKFREVQQLLSYAGAEAIRFLEQLRIRLF